MRCVLGRAVLPRASPSPSYSYLFLSVRFVTTCNTSSLSASLRHRSLDHHSSMSPHHHHPQHISSPPHPICILPTLSNPTPFHIIQYCLLPTLSSLSPSHHVLSVPSPPLPVCLPTIFSLSPTHHSQSLSSPPYLICFLSTTFNISPRHGQSVSSPPLPICLFPPSPIYISTSPALPSFPARVGSVGRVKGRRGESLPRSAARCHRDYWGGRCWLTRPGTALEVWVACGYLRQHL